MPKFQRVPEALLVRLAKRLSSDKIQLNKWHRLVQLLAKRDGKKYKTLVVVRVKEKAIFQGDMKFITGSVEKLGRGWTRCEGIIYFSGPDQVRDSLLKEKIWTD